MNPQGHVITDQSTQQTLNSTLQIFENWIQVDRIQPERLGIYRFQLNDTGISLSRDTQLTAEGTSPLPRSF